LSKLSKFIFGFARRIRRGFLVVRGCFSFRIKEEKKKRYLQEDVYKRKLKNFMKKRFVKKKEVNLIKKIVSQTTKYALRCIVHDCKI